MFSIFSGGTALLMANVVSFVVFFLLARLARAGQPAALAFGFTPLLLEFAIANATAAS